jgi:putative FmdB family regulatory protein
MPLYEYQCDACGRRFEKIQKFSDAPLEACALCGKGPVHKLLSSPAIQFKGSGWYITDYAKKGSTSGDTSSSNEPSKSGGSEKPGETKTEAAPAKPEASTKSSS